MRKRNREVEEIEEEGEETVELSEKEQKKLKLKTAVEKRKNARKKDKVARWGGIILLGLMMFVGFLLWVSGEMKSDSTVAPTMQVPSQRTVVPLPTQSGSIIVR